MSNVKEFLKGFDLQVDDTEVKQKVDTLLDQFSRDNHTEEVYRLLFSCLDLTSLNSADSNESIARFVGQVNYFSNHHPDLENVAAVCVFPNRVAIVRSELEDSSVRIASVAGGFPSAQTFPEVKVAEAALAVADGANEIDIVFPLGEFSQGYYEEVVEELSELKDACRDARLKVILETGLLPTQQRIRTAALLALYAGADFIKTSTGKVGQGATPEAVYTMCVALKEYYQKTGRRAGIKVSGGVAYTEDAVTYYTIVREVLGEEWLSPEYFRIGASRLANHLLSSISGKEITIF